MKNLTLTILFVVAALGLQSFYCAAQITGTAQVCAGQSFPYTSSLPGTLTWNVNPSGATVVSGGSTAQITWGVPAGTYIVYATNGDTSESYTVNVYAIPAPHMQYAKNPCNVSDSDSAGGGGIFEKCDSFCVNEVVTYTVTNTPGNTYVWTMYPSTGGTILSGQGTNSVNVLWGPGSGGPQSECPSLCVVETNPAGCSAQACVHGVSAYFVSPITLTASASYVCLGNPITFTANSTGTFQNYTWDFGNANTTTTSGNSVSYTYPSPGTYTVIVTGNTKCCHESDTITVVVDSLPGPDIFCITPVCSNTEGVQYCTSATNCNYSWVVTGGNIVGPDSTNCITVDWGSGPVGTISLTTSGCNPALCPATTVVTVPIMPSGPFPITGPIVVCIGSTGTYSAPYVPASQYTWTITNPASITTTLPYSSPPYIQSYTFLTAGTYTLKCHMQNDILECEGDGIIVINVRDSFLIIGGTTACVDSVNAVTFNSYFSNFTPDSSNWTSSPNIGSFTNTSTASFIFTSPGTYVIIATATNPNLVCNSPDSITVTVNPVPATPVITGNTIVCPGGTYVYSTSGYSGSAQYNWLFFDGTNYTGGSGNPFTATFPNIFSSGTLTLTVYENGCSATTIIYINAPSPPAPVILPDTINVCPGQSITYSATLSYPLLSTVQWTVNPSGAGTVTSGQGTATVTVLWNAGYTSAVLTVTETTCLIQTGNANLNITFYPAANINSSGGSACNGVPVTLTATGGVSYVWFSSNAVQQTTGATFTTSTPGNYYVTGTDANGCKANAYVQVISLPLPVVQVSGPSSAHCNLAGTAFDTVQLFTTFNGPGYIFNWSNGSTSDTAHILHPGTDTVTVTNTNGCKVTQIFSITCSCPTSCPQCVDGGACDGNGDLVTPDTLNAPSGTSYQWSPNGETTASITVTDTGLYSVVVYDPSNVPCPYTTHSFYVHCSGSICPYATNVVCTASAPTDSQSVPNCNVFSFLPNSTCSGTPVWNFGDGSFPVSSSNPTHTYSQAGIYTVCYGYSGTPPCNPGASACTPVTVPVAANFSVVVNCLTASFTDLSNWLSGYNVIGWSWDFGDASPLDTNQNPSHTYSGGGTYNVTLTDSTVGGCKATITISVIITAPSITGTVQLTACNSPVQFTGTVNGGSTTIVSWNWAFGDASSSNLQNPQHTYLPGSYNWVVSATDGSGCTATDTGTIVVGSPPPPFNLNDTTSCGPIKIGAPSTYVTYQWYNNGTIIPGATDSTYLAVNSGNYSVTVTDANGCVIQSTPAMVIINTVPPIALTVSPQPVCSSGDITVNSNTSGNVTVTWTSNVIPPPNFQGFSIQWSNVPPGVYTVSCVITDNVTGCTTNGTITFTVNPSPTVTITNSNPSGVCSGNSITLTANASPVISYNWSNGGNTSVITVTSGGVYAVTVTDAVGCTASASSFAKIFPLPDLQMLPIGCDSACINPVADTIHGPPGMANYDWQINGVPVSTLQDLLLNPTNLPNYNVAYQITLIATTVNGCIDSTTFAYTPKDCDTSSVSCYTLKDTIWCNTDGTYSFQIMVTNHNASTTASILVDDYTYPFVVNGSSINSQLLNVPANGNSGWFPSTPYILSNPTNLPTPSVFCFHTLIIYGDTCCQDSLCIELPNCDPCDNISVSTESDSASCCQQISITNNFSGNYFSGVSVVPISFGATIASTTLGVGGAGWASSGNNMIMSFYPPGNSTIPLGATNDLVTLCLNLQIGAATPQIVLFNWFVPDANGMDSVVCTDTLVFNCEPPSQNPCGEIHDSIICLGNGSYQYTFTLINHSPNPIPEAAIDMMNPQTGVNFPSLVFFFNPPIAPGDSATQTFTFTTTLPAGSTICYHMTLLDSIGCCCHAVDTVCFTLPECDSIECACGSWALFSAGVTEPNSGTTNYPVIECGTYFTSLTAGTSVTFTGGGYNCTGDSSCSSVLNWSIAGGTPSSGTGLPSFVLNNGGTFILTMYGYCGGHLCDSCRMTFIVDTCECGHWDAFNLTTTWQSDGENHTVESGNQSCGSSYTNVDQHATITFNTGNYVCLGDAATCSSSIQWNVTGNASPSSGTGLPAFTLNGNGTYVLTLYGYCGGHLCDSCTFRFTTKPDSCVCGSWQPFTITTSQASYINQPCGGSYVSQKNIPITINGSYHCAGGDSCSASYSWTVTRNSNFYQSGSGLPITFTPNATGTYVVTISTMCNGIDCEGCSFTFKVTKNAHDLQHGEVIVRNSGDIQLHAAPNPARDIVTLSFSSDEAEAGMISWYNELGIAMKQTFIEWNGGETKIEMNVSDLAAGIYMVRLNGENGSAFVKVMVYR